MTIRDEMTARRAVRIYVGVCVLAALPPALIRSEAAASFLLLIVAARAPVVPRLHILLGSLCDGTVASSSRVRPRRRDQRDDSLPDSGRPIPCARRLA